MIQFEKSKTNTVTVTLTENATVSNPIYLFKFNNEQTNVDYYFIASDTSQYKERYNQFQVTEKTSPNTLNGEVYLDHEGFYTYTAYQTSLSTTVGLADAEAAVQYIVKEVETGLVWVIPSTTSPDQYVPQSDTSIVYQPE